MLYFMLKIYMLSTEQTLMKNDSIFFNAVVQNNSTTNNTMLGFGEPSIYSDSLTINSSFVTIGYKLGTTNENLLPVMNRYVKGQFVLRQSTQNPDLTNYTQSIQVIPEG